MILKLMEWAYKHSVVWVAAVFLLAVMGGAMIGLLISMAGAQ